MRTVKKTISYSVTHFLVAVAVAYGLTQDWRAALAIGLIEPIFQTLAYAVHERVWERLSRTRATEAAPLRSATT